MTTSQAHSPAPADSPVEVPVTARETLHAAPIFDLVEGISSVPEADLHTREGEEAGIVPTWLPLADAVAAVLRGAIHNPSAVAAVLALQAVRTDAGSLRDARAPWEHQPRIVAPGQHCEQGNRCCSSRRTPPRTPGLCHCNGYSRNIIRLLDRGRR